MSDHDTQTPVTEPAYELAESVEHFDHFEMSPNGEWRAVTKDDAGEWSADIVVPKLQKIDLAKFSKEPMTKREFNRAAPKFIAALAFGAVMIGRTIKGASAVTCWFWSQETRYSSSCPTLQSCWFTTHCSDGTVRVYRAYCGRCTATP